MPANVGRSLPYLFQRGKAVLLVKGGWGAADILQGIFSHATMVVISRSELQRMQASVAEGVVTKAENKRVSVWSFLPRSCWAAPRLCFGGLLDGERRRSTTTLSCGDNIRCCPSVCSRAPFWRSRVEMIAYLPGPKLLCVLPPSPPPPPEPTPPQRLIHVLTRPLPPRRNF